METSTCGVAGVEPVQWMMLYGHYSRNFSHIVDCKVETCVDTYRDMSVDTYRDMSPVWTPIET